MSDKPNSADMERCFAGLERLYGVMPAQRIRAAHVVVVGIGGVGSWAAEALARSGVGRLTLIDMDHIALSNLNRQIHALTTTAGQAKVVAMRERIALINPYCEVQCIDEFVDVANWEQLLPADATAVIDACDQVSAKTAMAAWAIKNKAIFIAVGAAGGKTLGHKVDVADLAHATHDPLLAQLRYRLRKHYGASRSGISMGLAVVFSPEAVKAADPSCAVQGDSSLNCHGYGSTVAVTATFGLCASGWVLNKISAIS